MIIFLYGPDTYRLRQNEQKIISAYKAKHPSGFNLTYCDASTETGLAEAESAVKSLSFFDEIKLVAIKNVFSGKQDSKSIFSLIKNYRLLNELKVVLMISEPEEGKKLSSVQPELFKLISGPKATICAFDFLKGIQLQKWVAKEFESRDKKISSQGVKALIAQEGNESWRLATTIEMLANYVSDAPVSALDVAKFKTLKSEANIFAFIDSLSSGPPAQAGLRRQAFTLLYQELKSGQEAQYILTMIAYQLRTLLMVKDASKNSESADQISKKTGLKPFVVSKCLRALAKIDLPELIASYRRLGQIELASKRGLMDIEDALYRFVLS